MKLFEVSSSFGVVIQKFTDDQFDLVFVCQKEGKTKFEKDDDIIFLENE